MESLDSNDTLDTQKLHWMKEQLLGDDDQSEVQPRSNPSRDEHEISGDASNPPPLEASNVNSQTSPTSATHLSSSRNRINSRRVTTSSDHAPPRLLASKSSPVVSMTMENRSAASRQYHSFAAYHDDIGDTQPMETQVYKDYSDAVTFCDALNGDIPTLGHETGEHTIGAMSYHEGDTGHLDFDAVIEAAASAGQAAQETVDVSGEETDDLAGNDDEDSVSIPGDSPEIQFRLPLNDSGHFAHPKTPAMRGKKRDCRGEVLSSQARTSSTKTPGSALAAIFGNNKGTVGMSMTQIFQTTQAASSPLPNGLRSDPVFQRPSPNLNFSMQPTSPVAMSMSSPPKGLPTSDPLPVYRTMNESQEQRARRLQAQKSTNENTEDDDFFSQTIVERHFERQQLLKKSREEVSKSFGGVTAPPRPGSRDSGRPSKFPRRKSAIDTTSLPLTSSVRRRTRKAPSSVEPLDDPDIVTDEESEDELRIQVANTSSHPYAHSQTNGAHHDASQESAKGYTNSQSKRAKRRMMESPAATQKTVAVADSQADPPERQTSPPPAPVQFITGSSVVENSQQMHAEGPISQTRTLFQRKMATTVETSSGPRPPIDSTQLPEELAMPSSPPMMLSVQDINDLMDEGHEIEGDSNDTKGRSQGCPSQPRAEKVGATRCMDPSPSKARSEDTEAEGIAEASIPTNKESDQFETAPSHLSSHQIQDSGSRLTNVSQKASRFKSLTQIAAEPTSQNSFDGSIDLNINIISEEEQKQQKYFERLMSGSSPVNPNKRRKVTKTHAKVESKILREPSQNLNGQIEEPLLQKKIPAEERQLSPPLSAPISGKRPSLDAVIPVDASKQTTEKPPTKSKPAKSTKRTATATGRPKPRTLKVLKVVEAPQPKASDLNRTTRDVPNNTPNRQQTSRNVSDTVADQAVSEHTELESAFSETAAELYPNRVLAKFKSFKMAYYPATCVGLTHTDGPHFKIRFDDGTVDFLDNSQVRKLDLRIGDWVKVDLPEMRTKTYVVSAFKDIVRTPAESRDELSGPGPEDIPLTDIRGYRTVQLLVKSRESLPTPDATEVETIDVPITSIYITSTMWTRFSDRKFVRNVHTLNNLQTRVATPSIALSEPSTPTSRSRRQATSSILGAVGRDVTATAVCPESTLFANMAFAVTFTNSDGVEKSRATRTILDHGGLLLESGFDELFDVNVPEPQSPKKSPRKSAPTAPAKMSPDNVDRVEPLRLVPSAQTLGFTALIADRYCRRAKYMQALALDIPCLHYRWLTDCISVSTVLPFQKYLLPAGESAFLSGSVRSRSLAPYNPISEAARLVSVLARRQLLLGGKSVLLIMGKGRNEERRKAYLFLTYALGASNVGRVRDLSEAKKALEGGDWDWIYADGNVQEAEKVLFSSQFVVAPENGKKKKRPTPVSAKDGAGDTGDATATRVKFVGDEFVIQSLILGELLDI